MQNRSVAGIDKISLYAEVSLYNKLCRLFDDIFKYYFDLDHYINVISRPSHFLGNPIQRLRRQFDSNVLRLPSYFFALVL